MVNKLVLLLIVLLLVSQLGVENVKGLEADHTTDLAFLPRCDIICLQRTLFTEIVSY